MIFQDPMSSLNPIIKIGKQLTEAMILGVPCISSDFKVAFEQIKDGKNGIILSMNDTESYKDRIEDIIKNKNKYNFRNKSALP